MKRVILVLGVVLLFLCAPLSAQLIQLDDENSFSDTRVRLDFWPYEPEAEAGDALAVWGIRFSSGPESEIRIGFWTDPGPIILVPPFPIPVVRNQGVPLAGSPNAPLTIDFAKPAQRVGFVLHSGVAGIVAAREDAFPIRVSAFDSEGSFLGELERESFGGNMGATLFLGIESEAGKSISKVVLDYGEAPNAEEIEAILVDFQQVPKFVSCLPQIAIGAVPNGSLRFSITVTNLGGGVATGAVALKDPSGDDLALELNGTVANSFPFEVPAYGTFRLSPSAGPSGVVRGYALIESDAPVFVSEVFQVLDADGKVVQEAGIDAEPPEAAVFAPASRHLGAGLDTGVAVANLADSTLLVFAGLFEDGAGGFFRERLHLLAPGEQIALFLDELINFQEQQLPADLDATLRIRSSGEISVTILRTVDGVVSASLPVGTPQRR